MNFYDAHNHLQDGRFVGRQNELLASCAEIGVARMVVNGTRESDWPQVLALARQFNGADASANGFSQPEIIPSFGYHPWYLHERTPDWQKNLEKFLNDVPSAIGEIGLDRWKPGLSWDGQEEVFLIQLRLATERNRPVSIHCLQAWGRLHELLRDQPRPARGFLLHSYGGPAEMVPALVRLGAYFSFSGSLLNGRKARQREVFKLVPPDRQLVETDAPDQPLPEEKILHPLAGADGRPLNHPANLAAVYAGIAEFLGEPMAPFAARIEDNFQRLFGGFGAVAPIQTFVRK